MARGSLKQYWKKRDFGVTAEPRGVVARTSQTKGDIPYARFTVQKHDASRLHFDLRLEIDGVYKSWAVPKGPSLDPADKRLAVQVEDHPLDYGTFEGTIPEGQYGGGTVQLWDQGYFAAVGDASEGVRKGNLKFVTLGKRMKGGWALVRLHGHRPGEKDSHKNWLLIKERDEEARSGKDADIASIDKSVKTGRRMKQIAEDTDSPVWNSNRGDNGDPPAKARASRKSVARIATRKAAKKKTTTRKTGARKRPGRKASS